MAFDALLEERSVTRAAKRLKLSQPAMSNTLARLREGVGDPLFERTRHGIEPTARALAMAEPVRAAMASLQLALTQVEAPKSLGRTLRVAVNSYAQWLLLPAVARAMPAAPLPFSLDLHRPDPNSSSEVVLAVDWRNAVARPPGTRSAVIIRDSLACVVRRGNRSVGDRYPLGSFLESEHIGIGPEPNRGTDIVDAALATLGKNRRLALAVPDFVSAAWLVSRTDFVAVIPRRLAESLAPALGLGILSVPLDLADLVLEVSWPSRSSDDPLVMWLKARIVSAGRQLAESQKA